MSNSTKFDAWSAGDAYQHYMGRWSAQVADVFIDWLAPPSGATWLDVGCGTGALTAAVLQKCDPVSILAIDQSEGFVQDATKRVGDDRARFQTADAQNLPAGDGQIDVVTSGLVLNFVPDMQKALSEMQRVLKPGGLLSFYVWDYPGGGMGFIDVFWKAAARLDPKAAELDESTRFPVCTPDGLAGACASAGLTGTRIDGIETETVFEDFEAFWKPFTMGAGPAPGYCAALSDHNRAALKAELAKSVDTGGKIRLPARAWAVKATV